ncbi:hypothetical protein BJ979_002969 [Schumannella luteola]|uniref:Uncharacterized protein n=1 Tax=Schumannella luteola TaxID=472059 RepID=A0A852YCU1_9MICO|nr:hypothetical protein [Schumannella luteola]
MRQPAHPRLRRLPEVAEQQHAQPRRAVGGSHRERHARGVAGLDSSKRRPEHLPREIAEASVLAARDLVDARSRVCEPRIQPVGVGAVGGADQNPVGAADHRVAAADVIEVVVREHDEGEPVDAEIGQAVGEQLGVRAGVDERDLVVAAQQGGIALPDVAERDTPVGRAADSPRDRGAADAGHGRGAGDDEHPRGGAAHPSARASEHRDQRDHEDDRHQHRSQRAVEPGHAGGGQPGGEAGDRRDPRRGNPGEGAEQVTERRHDREQETCNETEHGRDRRRRFGQEVRGHTVERQDGLEQDQHGLAEQLRRERHRDGEREEARHPALQPSSERRREHEQPRCREHREHEAVAARETGVGDHEHEHRGAEHGEAAHRTPQGECQQDDARHHGRAHDTRLGCDERDESEQGDAGADHAHEPRGAEQCEQAEDERDHDGAVGARHGREMGERGDLHRILEPRIQLGGVADREPRQQLSAVARQARGRLAEARTQRVEHPVAAARPRHDDRIAAGEQQHCAVVAGLGRGGAGGRLQRRAERHRIEALREQHAVGVECRRRAALLDGDDMDARPPLAHGARGDETPTRGRLRGGDALQLGGSTVLIGERGCRRRERAGAQRDGDHDDDAGGDERMKRRGCRRENARAPIRDRPRLGRELAPPEQRRRCQQRRRGEPEHRRDHDGATGSESGRDDRRAPGRTADDRQPKVGGAHTPGVGEHRARGEPRSMDVTPRRAAVIRGAHTVTSGCSCSKVFSPMPLTSRRSSIEAKRPFC